MSYILDALTRAEQERQCGTVPDLRTVHAPLQAEPMRDTRWFYLAAAALASVAVVSAAWMYTRKPAKPDQPAQPVARQQREANAVERGNMASPINPAAGLAAPAPDRLVTVTPQQRITENVPAPQPRAVTPDEEQRMLSRKPPPAPDTKRSPTDSLIPSENVLGTVVLPSPLPPGEGLGVRNKGTESEGRFMGRGPAPQRRAVTLGERQRKVPRRSTPAADARSSPDAPRGAPQPAPVASAPAVASRQQTLPTPPSDQRVFSVNELPASLQRELPPISISGFARSSDPKDRMVIINERVIQEGEELAPGLKVEEIVPNGVTFSYKGYRFRSVY